MDALQRTQSRESARSTSKSGAISLSSASSGASRKARSAENETTSSSVERAGVSMPAPASRTVSRAFIARRPSKASDTVLLTSAGAAGGALEASGCATASAADAPVQHGDGAIAAPYTEGRLSDAGLPHPSSLTSAPYPHHGALSSSPQTLLARENASAVGSPLPGSALNIPGAGGSPTSQTLNWATAWNDRPQSIQRSRSRTRTQRRISGTAFSSSASPGSERSTAKDKNDKAKAPLGIIGVCALDTKARSKPSRNILNKLMEKQEFDVKVFGDKVILDEDIENWPVCDYLISFFSDGFPLDKAIAYSKLRKPMSVNDLPMQYVLWDRRLCLMILDKIKVPTPERVEVNRDGGPRLASAELARVLYDRTGIRLPGPEDGTGGGQKPPRSVELIEDGEALRVDGKVLRKPFVEKPVSGEDHNIRIYLSKEDGGGGRRLFRKVNNKSSEYDPDLSTPRCLLEQDHSYIYEKFLKVENSEDVKAYTVGPGYCHAETRKSPVVDGIVRRNPNGKELRYVAQLTKEEIEYASRIVKAFGQTVCGFDILRCHGTSYVIDVNGWSFVKDNPDYYDAAAKILRDMFIKEKARREGKAVQPDSVSFEWEQGSEKPATSSAQSSRKPQGGHRNTLKGLFHSPSMSKLTGSVHSPVHMPVSHRHGATSPDIAATTLPISSPPSTESSVPATRLPPPVSQPPLHAPSATVSAASTADVMSGSHMAEVPAVPVPAPASKAQWKLKGVVSVVRHADRTPKQKFKFTFHTKPFVDLLKGHQEEVLLVGEPALNSVLDAVKEAFKEGIEDKEKLNLLRSSLIKKGGWAGTKVQIKPMFRRKKKEELQLEMSPSKLEAQLTSDDTTPDHGAQGELERKESRQGSVHETTLSRFSAKEHDLVLDKLQLIIKWGGEPTHSARYQSQDLGENLRSDLMIMNRECLEDVHVFSSSERRVTTSAQIFTAAFLAKKELPEDFITVRKDLLDDSNAAKDEMDKVKKKLKLLLREGDAAPPQFAWPDNTPEPFIVVRNVVELMKFHRMVMRHNMAKLQTGAATYLANIINPRPSEAEAVAMSANGSASVSVVKESQEVAKIQPRWCSGEDANLFRERWEKLFKEFCDETKVDPSKISELYDTMKYDALHNRQFLEWVFTPEEHMLDEIAVSESGPTSPTLEAQPKFSANSSRRTSISEPKEANHRYSVASVEKVLPEKERSSILAQRFAHLRRRPSVEEKPTNNVTSKASVKTNDDQESYFTLYTGITGNGQSSKAKVDSRLHKLRELYKYCKVLFDYIGPQEYGISGDEKLEIGLLTSLPLLREIVQDLEDLQASEGAKSFFYFTKESHIYTLLNCILEGGVKTKIERKAIPELDYLSQIQFELYESQNSTAEDEPESFNYSIRISISPGCHTFDPLDVMLDSKHCIGCAPRRSLTAHVDYQEILDTLKEKFAKVKLPKTFTAVNLSEKGVFGDRPNSDSQSIKA
ncbi:uncharacterized protein PV09_01033 [Verruconis gallopava]|uniref:Inositol hexakisphosphate and diphosphoinositol-pentakisphosphate kinase n=1 Tax=Verruconis gallopava TaxID=253628 RepID=A0A0D2ANK8_9PEZI|nr:uncharacterized protein PV09_01033 [Verruconis gallopava]KIW08095.1 hypothetical protein PV09_01033 [Verruconis gallopava]